MKIYAMIITGIMLLSLFINCINMFTEAKTVDRFTHFLSAVIVWSCIYLIWNF